MEGGKEVRRKKEKTRPPRKATRRSIRPHAHSHPFEEAQRKLLRNWPRFCCQMFPTWTLPKMGRKF
jgi:hypothetical protein